MNWKAWYINNKTYSSKTTTWADLPSDGLIALVVYQNGDKQVYTDETYYWMDDSKIFADNKYPKAGQVVKLGTKPHIAEFSKICDEANNSLFD